MIDLIARMFFGFSCILFFALGVLSFTVFGPHTTKLIVACICAGLAWFLLEQSEGGI